MIVAEGKGKVPSKTAECQLQWGRNLIVAEGDVRCVLSLDGKLKLQWGRNLIVAEGKCVRDEGGDDDAASMGPQLDSCGRRPRLAL